MMSTMRLTGLILTVAATLGVAAPALAQRQSLADRVAALEAQAQANQGNTVLLNQLDQLRNEVTSLRGTIEQLQNENEQLKQRARDQFLDLDGRLGRLEGGAGGAPAAPAGNAPPIAPPSASNNPPAGPTPPERAPAVHGDPGAVAQAADERTAYNVAFDALKGGKYVDAANLFTSFLELYPSGVYAPNAMYWLGESYYVTQNYEMAAQQFRGLLGQYPTHDKAPGAMLKLGLAQYGLGQVQQAEGTLKDVIGKYPNSDVARTANDRLRSIQLGQLR
jgi:tol-pal system protein YbgF